MRNVDPKDEVPIRWLTDESIEKRIANMKNVPVPKAVKHKGQRLQDWLFSLEGKNVENRFMMYRVYKFVDLYMEKAVLPQTVCRKGCSACCYVNVQTTPLEASYIEEMTGIKMNKLMKGYMPHLDQKNTPCPFLKDGVCSVYDYRPMACRSFATIDHWKHCEDPTTPHMIHAIKSQPFLEFLFGTLHGIGSRFTNYSAYADIREWFGDEQ